jgi:ADP-ribose pyrophosphatase YjhB (NUDIX family)
MSLPSIDDYPARFQYRCCPLCGAALERRRDDHRERLACPRDGWIFYPTPNLAATVVVEHQGGVVLLRRGIPPDPGIWHLPIGHLEYGETPADAVIRETAEETGLQLSEAVFLDFECSPSIQDPLLYYIVFCYCGKAAGGEMCIDAENSEARIFSADELPELKWTSQRRAVAAWKARRQGKPWVVNQPLPDR